MDPFTQRMRERALLRQEKLNSKLKDAGLEPTKVRSPLKEQVHQTHTVKITTEVEVSISKPRVSEAKAPPAKAGDDSFMEFMSNLDESCKENESDEESESSEEAQGKSPVTSCSIRDDSRSRLKRLGTLYSESPSALSSPIHRTEEKFSVEPTRPGVKTPARSARLAALANTINQWEDDLSHPTAAVEVPAKVQVSSKRWSGNMSVSPSKRCSGNAPVSPTKRASGYTPESPSLVKVQVKTIDVPKHVTWDKAILDTLETQGFTRSKSNSRLIYDYNHPSGSQDSSSSSAPSPPQPSRPWQRPNTASSSNLQAASPEKPVRVASPAKPVRVASPEKPVRVASPEKPVRVASPEKRGPRMVDTAGSPANGSVLHKAAMFETSPSKKKDPAEMTLAERMALFERHKGEALLPKSAFGIPAPMPKAGVSERAFKALGSRPVETVVKPAEKVNKPVEMFKPPVEVTVKPAPSSAAECSSMVAAQRQMFERGGGRVAHQNIAATVQSERQKEMAMLLNRWDRNKMADEVEVPVQAPPQAASTPPPAPPMPALMSPPPPPMMSPLASPVKNLASPSNYPGVKRIKVSPPKPGNIYPCLSDIETATEAETDSDHQESREYSSSELESSLEGGESSFGRSIMQAVRSDAQTVLRDMDQLLDEAMDSSDDEGVTPPKKSRDRSSSKAVGSDVSHSFKYSRGDVPTPVSTPVSAAPLLHTVSFYRRQQNSGSKKTPVRTITRQPETSGSEAEEPGAAEKEAVNTKITYLLRDVAKQQVVISQASQAINLASSTVEFSGSAELIEAERLLLFATHARQAALNEVQRLKVEGSLKPLTEFGQIVDANERGNVTISDIQLPLKPDYLRRMAKDAESDHFMMLVKHQDQVLATHVVTPAPHTPALVFPGAMRLSDLYSDFKVVLEVYSMRSHRVELPHDVKYHINKKDKGRGTPKKQSRLAMPVVQSPAGPGAVRSPAFRLSGFVTFSLSTLKRTQFTLNNLAHGSPLEGQVRLSLSSRLTTDVEQRGFLTMFEDVSGLGAWHRRWCVLRGQAINYWRYPDEEKTKVPMGGIDLSGWSSSSVERVPYDVCARPETFVLKMVRPLRPGDRDSLVLTCSAGHATIRYMLSADTKEERVLWCDKLGKALTMMRAWGDSAQQ